MCIRRAGGGTDRSRPRQTWGCAATVCPLRVLPLPARAARPDKRSGSFSYRKEIERIALKCENPPCNPPATVLPQNYTLPHPQRQSRLYVTYPSLGTLADLVAGLCEN